MTVLHEVPLNRKKKLPNRKPNSAYRQREYLYEKEINQMLRGAAYRRYPVRDRLIIDMMFRHALRISELADLRWLDIDFNRAKLNVRRKKGGISGSHPIQGDILRQLRKLKRETKDNPYIFVSERGDQMAIPSVRSVVMALGESLDIKVHPHMLRHSCGYYLTNSGVDLRTIKEYMGHRRLSTTVIYTALNSTAFNGLFR